MSTLHDFVDRLLLALVIWTAVPRYLATSDGDIHECLRPCENEPSSRKICRYEFFVSELAGRSSVCNGSKNAERVAEREGTLPAKSFLAVNGRSPGPSIQVCLGDTIEVLVYNRLGADELSFHWHGIRQHASGHMDGVPMVTQCPILPYGGFRYKIRPESTGTYFYHAHSVSQQGDGVYGSLTVRGPRDEPTLERILLLSSRPPTPLTRHAHLGPPTPCEILVNGQASGTILRVENGAQYLLRLVNANACNCPLLVSVSKHEFRALATDGNSVQGMTASRLILFPGERLDVLLEANQPAGKYPLAVDGLQDCRDLLHEVVVTYDGTPQDSPSVGRIDAPKPEDLRIGERGHDCAKITGNVICALDLKGSSLETITEEETEETIYIPFDVHSFTSVTDDMTDDSFSIFDYVYYPAYLTLKREETKIPQINGMSFKYPSSPILSQPENTSDKVICSLEQTSVQCEETPLFCECVQILELPPMKTVEIVLIDEGLGGNTSYTFHVHGYNASIVGHRSFEHPISKEEIVALDRKDQLHRNLLNPPRKDTFVVPNKGYVILRFYTDNLGYWLWEARSTAISPGTSGPGMQFLMRVGSQESLPLLPLEFPTCGGNKGPFMIFEKH